MRTSRLLVALAAPAAAVCLIGGCGGSGSSNASGTPQAGKPSGDIPDTQAYVPYSPPTGGYTLKVPEGWARADTPTGASFTDNLNSIRVETHPAPNAPDVTSVRAVELSSLRSSTSGFQLKAITSVQRPAGVAVLVNYLANGPADPVTGKRARQDVQRYEFWHQGVQVVLTLASPVGADNVDPWRKITDSFAWQG